MTGPEIRFIQATKNYGKAFALSELSLLLGTYSETQGTVWGLLGPNGSGKSTMMKMMAGIIRPSTGEVRVCGGTPFANPEVLKHIGICPEADALYNELTGFEFVASMARLSGMGAKDAKDKTEAMLVRMHMQDAMHRPGGTYSRGMRQKIKLAQALIHEPKVLLLDEPLSGTDVLSKQEILKEVHAAKTRGALVVFSSHVLHEIESVTDQVLLVAKGQLVAQGRVQSIREMLTEYPHKIEVACDKPRVLATHMMERDTGVVAVRLLPDDVLELQTHQPDKTYTTLSEVIANRGIQLKSMHSPDANLESLFAYLVERAQSRKLANKNKSNPVQTTK